MVFSASDVASLKEYILYFQDRVANLNDDTLRKSFEVLLQTLNSELFTALVDVQEYYGILCQESTIHAILGDGKEQNNGYAPKPQTAKKEKVKKSREKLNKFDNTAACESVEITEDDLNLPRSETVAEDISAEEIAPVVADPQENELAIVTEQKQVVEEEWFSIEVILYRGPTGFGFCIAGGRDQHYVENDNGIFVTKITTGGAADQSGNLFLHDIIGSVNNIPFDNINHQDAVDTLKNSGNTMHLIVYRNEANRPGSKVLSSIESQRSVKSNHTKNSTTATPGSQHSNSMRSTLVSSRGGPRLEEEIDVELIKPPGYTQGFGFSISGGPGNEVVEEDNTILEGIIVTRIIEGGIAEANGQLIRGDRLIEVNGTSLWIASHGEAVQLLRSSGNRVKLRVVRYKPRTKQQRPPSASNTRSEDAKTPKKSAISNLFKPKKKN